MSESQASGEERAVMLAICSIITDLPEAERRKTERCVVELLDVINKYGHIGNLALGYVGACATAQKCDQ